MKIIKNRENVFFADSGHIFRFSIKYINNIE